MLVCKECFRKIEDFICSSDMDFTAYISGNCNFCKGENVIVFRLESGQIAVFNLIKDYLYQTGHIKSD